MSTTKNNIESIAAAVDDAETLADSYNAGKSKAAALLESASDSIHDTANTVKKSVKKYIREVDAESDAAQESIVDFISEYPLASVGLAFLSGLVITKIFGK